jgi:hypothetical protein
MARSLIDLVKRLDPIDDDFQIRRRAVDGITPHAAEVGMCAGAALRHATRLLRHHDAGHEDRTDDAAEE